jgi:hypothetical protein
MIMENHGDMMMSTEENFWLVYQSSLAIPQAESPDNKQQKRAKGMTTLAL